MRTLVKLALPLSLTLSLVLGTTIALGKKPATPLGKWMNANISSNMTGDADGFAALKTQLAIVQGNPPKNGSYPKWVEMTKASIAAADKQDLKAVKATCKTCHDAYQEQYIKENPTVPFP
jgi:hypothetical protein